MPRTAFLYAYVEVEAWGSLFSDLLRYTTHLVACAQVTSGPEKTFFWVGTWSPLHDYHFALEIKTYLMKTLALHTAG